MNHLAHNIILARTIHLFKMFHLESFTPASPSGSLGNELPAKLNNFYVNN